jgi:nucleotide-binding universal stress UspA family protein
MKSRIFVPYDFSDNARQALAWAAELHRAIRATEPVRLAHVISTLSVGAPDSVIGMLVPTPEEIATLERDMTAAAAQAEVSAIPQVVIRPLPTAELVVAAATEANADLIVMGTHGRTGVKRLVLGSVAEHVVRHARCPVVTIRMR